MEKTRTLTGRAWWASTLLAVSCAQAPDAAPAREALLIDEPTRMSGSFVERDVRSIERTTLEDGSILTVEESTVVLAGDLSGTAAARTTRRIAPTGEIVLASTMQLRGTYGRTPVTLALGALGQGSAGTLQVLQGVAGTTPLAGSGTLDFAAGTWTLEGLPWAIELAFTNDYNGESLYARVERGQQDWPTQVVIAPTLRISNPSPSPMVVERVEVFAEPGHSHLATWQWAEPFVVDAYDDRGIDGPGENLFLESAPPRLSFEIEIAGTSHVYHAARWLSGYQNTVASGGYRFPGADDLPEGAYWTGWTRHAGGSQRYGYDLGAVRWDSNEHEWVDHVDDGALSPSDYFIYDADVHAMAGGFVVECNRSTIDNASALIDQNVLDPDVPVGGNYLILRSGDEEVKYSHMRFESIPEEICAPNVWVEEGTRIGRVGNTGTATPHLHLHLRSVAENAMLPLPFRDADIVDRASADPSALELEPWVTLGSRMLPGSQVLIRPGVPRCRGLAATLLGTEGDDSLIGGPGVDVIVGGQGDDVIEGTDGDDVICGGGGHDLLIGGRGRDWMLGGAGNDEIQGDLNGNGLIGDDDEIHGGDGDDDLDGERGDDVMSGGEGDDDVFGSLGDDRLSGDGGADMVRGNEGADVLSGGTGLTDWCEGGDGTDSLSPSDGCEMIDSVP